MLHTSLKTNAATHKASSLPKLRKTASAIPLEESRETAASLVAQLGYNIHLAKLAGEEIDQFALINTATIAVNLLGRSLKPDYSGPKIPVYPIYKQLCSYLHGAMNLESFHYFNVDKTLGTERNLWLRDVLPVVFGNSLALLGSKAKKFGVVQSSLWPSYINHSAPSYDMCTLLLKIDEASKGSAFRYGEFSSLCHECTDYVIDNLNRGITTKKLDEVASGLRLCIRTGALSAANIKEYLSTGKTEVISFLVTAASPELLSRKELINWEKDVLLKVHDILARMQVHDGLPHGIGADEKEMLKKFFHSWKNERSRKLVSTFFELSSQF